MNKILIFFVPALFVLTLNIGCNKPENAPAKGPDAQSPIVSPPNTAPPTKLDCGYDFEEAPKGEVKEFVKKIEGEYFEENKQPSGTIKFFFVRPRTIENNFGFSEQLPNAAEPTLKSSYLLKKIRLSKTISDMLTKEWEDIRILEALSFNDSECHTFLVQLGSVPYDPSMPSLLINRLQISEANITKKSGRLPAKNIEFSGFTTYRAALSE